MKRKVYILNQTGHDYSGLEYFGDVSFVYDIKKINVFRLTDRIREINDRIENIDPDDYIVMSGYSILNSVMVSKALIKNGIVNVLLYNAMSGEYVPRKIERSML
jgi:hypothetical protein